MKRAKKPPIPPKALRDIWDSIPNMVDCKGECMMSCGPVPAIGIERELVEKRAGHALGTDENLMCNMLTEKGLCSVYSVRPMICRLWGTVERLKCPRGCKPERWLKDEDAMRLYQEIEDLTGDEDSQDGVRRMLEQMTPAQRLRWEQAKAAWGNQSEAKHGPIRPD